MVLRWTAAGMLNASRSFRRLKGYRQMPQLVAALHRSWNGIPVPVPGWNFRRGSCVTAVRGRNTY
jgi:hypothetical protein